MKSVRFILFYCMVFLVSCGGQKTVVKKYYVLENPKQSQPVAGDSLPAIPEFCQLLDVRVYPAYTSRQIAHRNRTHEIEYYQNHEWAVRPQLFLEYLMVDYFGKLNVFAGIEKRFWQIEPVYALKTTVYNLEIVENKDFYVHLNIEFQLIDRKSNQVVVRHIADNSEKMGKKDLNLAAASMSNILANELDTFIDKIKQFGHENYTTP